MDMQTAGYILEDGEIVELSYSEWLGSYHGQQDDEYKYKGLPEYSSTHLEEDTCIRIYGALTSAQYETIERIVDMYLDAVSYCKVELWRNGCPIYYKTFALYSGACEDDTFGDEIVANWRGYDIIKAIKAQLDNGV